MLSRGSSTAIRPEVDDPSLALAGHGGSDLVPETAPRRPATGSTKWLTAAGLMLLVLVGGFLRLHNLDQNSVSHVEMYVPGIRLPHGISVPEERLTLAKVVTSTSTRTLTRRVTTS